jgi:hypothetical protein
MTPLIFMNLASWHDLRSRWCASQGDTPGQERHEVLAERMLLLAYLAHKRATMENRHGTRQVGAEDRQVGS